MLPFTCLNLEGARISFQILGSAISRKDSGNIISKCDTLPSNQETKD